MKNSLKYVVFCFVLCFRRSDHSLKFIRALQGETIVLGYSSTATYVDWYGPAHEEKQFRSVDEIDMYNQSRKWNISIYSDDATLKDSLPHKTRLNIVGNHTIGEFFLEITNVSVDDAGLYRCEIFTVIMDKVTVVTNSFIVQLKYIPNLSITYEPPMPIHEGSSLRICCLSNNRLPKQTVGWLNNTVGRQERHNLSTACLYFENIRRIDSGIYICKGEHEGQIVATNLTLSVLSTYSSEKKTLSSKDVVIIGLLVLIVLLLAVTGIYGRYLKRRYSKRVIDTINIEAGEENSDDSAHYIDIIEDNNVLTTSQENSNDIISTDDIIDMENMNIIQMSEEQHSSLSSNNSDTPEHLDNGYEHPYTTLIANSGDEDKHVYLISKQNSIIENTYPFINAACKQSYEIIEQRQPSDNARTHGGKENVKLNYGVNDLIETDDDSQ